MLPSMDDNDGFDDAYSLDDAMVLLQRETEDPTLSIGQDPYPQSFLMEQAYYSNAGYRDAENPCHSGFGRTDEAPNDYSGQLSDHGMPNHAFVLDAAQSITSHIGGAQKKRSHEDLDGDRSSSPSTRLGDHRLVRNQQLATSELASTSQGYVSRRSQALPWDDVDDRKQLKGKKRRLDSGDAFAVSTTDPEKYPSAQHIPDGPETSIGLYPRHRSLGIR